MAEKPNDKGVKMPEKKKVMPDITPDRDEPGTSDEIVMSGRIYYAVNRQTWDQDENRQYIATPDDMKDLEHGAVTYGDAACSDTGSNEDVDRRLNAILREREHKKKPPEYEL